MKKPKFVVIACCQGQPFYYFHKSLLRAVYCFIKQYLTKKKYGTMRFSLEEVYEDDPTYKIWKKQNGDKDD